MKVLITTGPTWEFIDPVRFISTPSTGMIGMLLAKEFKKRKASVCVITGPTPLLRLLPNIKIIKVISACEMFEAVKRIYSQFDIIIMSAAVSDFKPIKTFSQKLKRHNRKKLTINLTPTPDILDFLSKHKRKGQIIIGFSLESNNLLKNTLEKMKKKKVDLIVANKLPAFGETKVNGYLIYNNTTLPIKNFSKQQLAKKITKIAELLYKKQSQ
jgi:phosphopantothenoylcysteine decarboxylase/phosphopantothenate--cysteine ligase